MDYIDNYEFDILIKLAESNDLYAIKRLVDYYFYTKSEDAKKNTSEEIIPLENETIMNYLNILIEKGDSDAMMILGGLYYGDKGDKNEFVENDYSKAIYWYNKAKNKKILDVLENCNIDALNNLGYCYYYGRNNKLDYKKAFLSFAKATCLKHPNAMYKIGDMYKNGYFVEKNVNTSFYWYKKSFYYSHNYKYIKASVTSRLGQAYFHGEGTKISLFKSLKYLQIAEKHFYSLAIKKPMWSNSCFVNEPLKKVQELLEKVHEQLNLLI